MVERPREILVGAQIPRLQQLGSFKIWGKIFPFNFTIVAGNVRDVSLYLILQFFFTLFKTPLTPPFDGLGGTLHCIAQDWTI